jgi:hypothetical protein
MENSEENGRPNRHGGGVWASGPARPTAADDPEAHRYSGVLGIIREFRDRRAETKARRERDLLRLALVGERPPKIQGALGLWGAFLTLEGLMAFLTGLVMWGLFAPAIRFGPGGIEIVSRMSLAGVVVMALSVIYMGMVALGLLAWKAARRRKAEKLRAMADAAIAKAADARDGYVFSTPEDEAEAELLHEHDRIALAGKPLKSQGKR